MTHGAGVCRGHKVSVAGDTRRRRRRRRGRDRGGGGGGGGRGGRTHPGGGGGGGGGGEGGRDEWERQRAESQWIVAERPLCHLKSPVAYLSRLQTILPAARR